MVALDDNEDMIRIMKNKSTLRKLVRETIYTDNDYTLKEQQILRNIRKRSVEENKKEVKCKSDKYIAEHYLTTKRVKQDKDYLYIYKV